MATQTTTESASATGNGIKLLGEVVVPGASQFIDGNVKSGSLHLLGSVAALAMLGGPGGLLISAVLRGNSFTSSTLHKPLYKALFERDADDKATTDTTVPAKTKPATA
jgi:uncharacterized protein DUF6072